MVLVVSRDVELFKVMGQQLQHRKTVTILVMFKVFIPNQIL